MTASANSTRGMATGGSRRRCSNAWRNRAASSPTSTRRPAPPLDYLSEQPGGVFGEVSQDDLRTGAADRSQRLEHHPLAIEPALGDSRLEHRVLTRNLVGGN